MAVVTNKSPKITALDADLDKKAVIPPTPEYVFDATMELANGDSIGSTYRLIRVPSHFRPTSLRLSCDAITTCTADFGLYQNAANGGAVASVALFASEQALSSALLQTEISTEATAADIDKTGKRLWEILGLTADPGVSYDLTATLTAAAGSAGTIAVQLRGYFE